MPGSPGGDDKKSSPRSKNPKPRYADMEMRVKVLNRQKMQRRLGRSARVSGKQKEITVPAHLPAVPVKQVLKPVVVPERLSDDPGFIGRHFPRAVRNRDALYAFNDERVQLNQHKVWLMKQLNSVNGDIVLIKKRLKLANQQSQHLEFQDDIMSHRAKMNKIIDEEREKERQRKKEIARLTHYSKILLRMKERLWKEQSVFKRTMETYQNAMTAQSEEQRDIADTFRKVRYWKKVTERKLKNLKEATAAKVGQSLEKVADLEQIFKAREQTWKNFKDEEAHKVEVKKKVTDKAKAKDLASHMTGLASRHKIHDMNDKVEVYMEAFRQIRLITGLSYEHEIIDRYEHQHAYLKDMDDKIVFLRSQISKIKKEQEQMKKKRDKDRFKGKGKDKKKRNSKIDILQNTLTKMKSEKSSQKINFARYSKMLIEFGQSIDHTRGAMQWITLPPEHHHPDEDVPAVPVSELLRRVNQIDRKLSKMLNALFPESEDGTVKTALVADKAVLSRLIEDMVQDNANNVRILPKAERLANFLRDAATPRGKKVNVIKNNRVEAQQKETEAAFRAKEHEARLRRKAVRKGLTLEEVRKQYELIPHEHIDNVLDRDSLKTQATNFERKARKLERRTSVTLPKLPGGGGSHARSSKPELK